MPDPETMTPAEALSRKEVPGLWQVYDRQKKNGRVLADVEDAIAQALADAEERIEEGPAAGAAPDPEPEPVPEPEPEPAPAPAEEPGRAATENPFDRIARENEQAKAAAEAEPEPMAVHPDLVAEAQAEIQQAIGSAAADGSLELEQPPAIVTLGRRPAFVPLHHLRSLERRMTRRRRRQSRRQTLSSCPPCVDVPA